MATAAAVRTPAVAGSFYPADPGELAAAVDAFLPPSPPDEAPPPPKAVIVPHAGYEYSGAVAGAAILLLALSFNLVGDALRDALDPTQRGRG